MPERPLLELLIWSDPWPSGLERPDLLCELVQADIDAGFADWVDGGFPESPELVILHFGGNYVICKN